jgi:hypothetical protein
MEAGTAGVTPLATIKFLPGSPEMGAASRRVIIRDMMAVRRAFMCIREGQCEMRSNLK